MTISSNFSEGKPKILVVEDDSDIRDIMLVQLEGQKYDVCLAEDGFMAQDKIRNSGPFHLFILDWMIPGPSGIELCRFIRKAEENNKIIVPTPILMVTAKASPNFIITGLDAGADDYITKPFTMEVFLARVRALMRRTSSSALNETNLADKEINSAGIVPNGKAKDSIIARGPLIINQSKYEVTSDGTIIHLTISEFKILKGLMERPGHVFTRSQIIEKIAGTGVHVGGRTIDTQLVGLRKKLGVHGVLIETIRGIGYRFKENS